MKTIAFSFLLIFAVFEAAPAQNLLPTFSGNVTDINTGAPIQNDSVIAEVISGGMVQNYSYLTNSYGFYGDSVPVFGEGSVSVSTIDCNGLSP